jgi:uncharacterized Fe-S cluster-containing radical SAM superfamily protein
MRKILIDQHANIPLGTRKFQNTRLTAGGAVRASVKLDRLETLWFNTGTQCNIECVNCYIQSSPTNDRLSYLTLDEVRKLLDEVASLQLATREIAFTGGEPFMNPHFMDMVYLALSRGFEVLVLTNAMQPLQRPKVQKDLLAAAAKFGHHLTIRVSLDHYLKDQHETERGVGSYEVTLTGIDWLSRHGFQIHLAGRNCWSEDVAELRAGYRALVSQRGWCVDTENPAELVIFPELDEQYDVPEITTECWSSLGIDPSSMMCATSRMVVKRRGNDVPQITPCTLLPYDKQFNMGTTLKESLTTTHGAIENGSVRLNHPHCANFCVLGSGSCSVEG